MCVRRIQCLPEDILKVIVSLLFIYLYLLLLFTLPGKYNCQKWKWETSPSQNPYNNVDGKNLQCCSDQQGYSTFMYRLTKYQSSWWHKQMKKIDITHAKLNKYLLLIAATCQFRGARKGQQVFKCDWLNLICCVLNDWFA